MRKKYDEILDKMYFEIGSTLIDNDMCRKGIGIPKVDDEEIIRSNRRTYMNLKIMMLRLERALFGEKDYEEDETEISYRNSGENDGAKSGRETIRASRAGDFLC